MFSIKLGLKNLTRQKRRNGITILVIALFSSIAPAYWAAHKDPVKAIYHR
ncbi:hypothetical protein [Candidatus Infernicultor aquiphilus]